MARVRAILVHSMNLSSREPLSESLQCGMVQWCIQAMSEPMQAQKPGSSACARTCVAVYVHAGVVR